MDRKKHLTLRQIVIKGQPFESANKLMATLHTHGRESKYLEFKEILPFGNNAPKSTKYRFIKAAISFANTLGGFVVIGVTRDGNWQGLPRSEVESVDPATLTELINDYIRNRIARNCLQTLIISKKMVRCGLDSQK